jgi:hypothetical protein
MAYFPKSIVIVIIIVIVVPSTRRGGGNNTQSLLLNMYICVCPEGDTQHHGLINYIDTKAECRHLKKLICKGALRQVFIIVYRLEIQSVMLAFLTQLCELLPL